MSNKKHILVVTNSLNDLAAWNATDENIVITFAHTDERAIELSHVRLFDIAVVDGTDESIDIKKLLAILPILQNELTIINYKGEPAETLQHKVDSIFRKKKYENIKRFLVLDSSQQDIMNSIPPFSAN